MTIDDNDDLEQELEDTITRVKDVIAARQDQIEEYEAKDRGAEGKESSARG